METILIVDDNEDLRWNLSQVLKVQGYQITVAGDGRQGIKQIKKESPDLVLLDVRLPDMDGMTVLEEMRKIDKDLIIIMITAYAEVKDAVKAMKFGAFDYITKPFDDEELFLTIKRALQTHYLGKEVESLRRKLGETELIGESPQIKQVLNQVKIIAPTPMTVILQGESGTGKEIIAHVIHHQSTRRERPFIAVDCGAIPGTLAESELFGYEKGAFTGADARNEGKFEQANGGTLLLDEITNLSNAIQMKLLRVLQERKLQRIGGRRETRIDVRIIVATNTDLSEAVRAGKFRDDLFHRLNEFQINIPPLRERQGDIPVLAQYFLDEANQEFGKKINGFSAETMKSFLNNHWVGNVRELKNAIKRAVLLADSDTITPAQLSLNTISSPYRLDLQQDLERKASLRELLNKSAAHIEKTAIEYALAQAGGNKSKAAKILDIDRMTLYSKIKKLNLS